MLNLNFSDFKGADISSFKHESLTSQIEKSLQKQIFHFLLKNVSVHIIFYAQSRGVSRKFLPLSIKTNFILLTANFSVLFAQYIKFILSHFLQSISM